MLVEVIVHDWHAWLAEISDRPLPGGVAVAALAGAMGAALVAKATRVTLSLGGLSPEEQQAFEAAARAAREAQATLVDLAEADEAAFRRLMAVRKQGPADDEESRQERTDAWAMAIEVPLRVGETCRQAAAQLIPLEKSCAPAVVVDLEIGKSLLRAGAEAGLRTGRANIEDWREERRSPPTTEALARRLRAAYETKL
jgi:methenyltetrahydrofolate cyclohydrolase